MKYVYELIGTFFLVLTIGLTVLNPNSSNAFAPVAIGSILAVMIYAGAHVSSAHYNPAVSFSMYLRGKLSIKDLLMYWLFQVIGGVLAAYAVIYFKGHSADAPMKLELHALLAEFLFTFALCYVALNTTTTKASNGNSYFGFAIGFTVLAGAYAVGAISSAAFNPAVAIGESIMNLTSWSDLWIFIVGNFLGAILAALIVNGAEHKSVELKR